MQTGIITSIVIGKGFGFIKPDGGGKDLFFHFKQLGDGLEWGEQLVERSVRFDVEQSDKGPRATHVCAAW